MAEAIPIDEIVHEQTGEAEVPMMNPEKKNVFAQFRKENILCVIFLGNAWSDRISSS